MRKTWNLSKYKIATSKCVSGGRFIAALASEKRKFCQQTSEFFSTLTLNWKINKLFTEKRYFHASSPPPSFSLHHVPFKREILWLLLGKEENRVTRVEDYFSTLYKIFFFLLQKKNGNVNKLIEVACFPNKMSSWWYNMTKTQLTVINNKDFALTLN